MISYDSLRDKMKEKGISQYALIRRWHINPAQITRLKRNESVSPHTIEMFCKSRPPALPFFAVPGPILRSADKIQGRGMVKQPDLRYAEAREEGGPWMPERQAPIWRRCGKPGA